MAVNRNFRTCPSTGLVYHEPAEKLIRWNAVAGVVSLLVGGILALLVTLTPTRAGTYSIICNEYCGINHHTMASRLYVVKPK